MIAIFNSNRPVLLVGLLACTLLLYFFGIPAADVVWDSLEPLTSSDPVFSFVYLAYPLTLLFSVAITFVTAILLNRFVHDMKLMPKSTFVPALMYITIACMSYKFLLFDRQHVMNLLIVLMLGRIVVLYNDQNNVGAIFNLGFFIGLAVVLAPYGLLFIILLPLALSTMRSFILREWIIGVLGILTPLVWIFAGRFLLNGQIDWPSLYDSHSFGLSFDLHKMDIGIISNGLYLFIVLMAAMFYIQSHYMKSQIQVRKHLLIMMALLLITLASTGLSGDSGLKHFVIISVPLSVILSYFLLNISRQNFAEWVYGIFLFLILFFQYFPWLTNLR